MKADCANRSACGRLLLRGCTWAGCCRQAQGQRGAVSGLGAQAAAAGRTLLALAGLAPLSPAERVAGRRRAANETALASAARCPHCRPLPPFALLARLTVYASQLGCPGGCADKSSLLLLHSGAAPRPDRMLARRPTSCGVSSGQRMSWGCPRANALGEAYNFIAASPGGIVAQRDIQAVCDSLGKQLHVQRTGRGRARTAGSVRPLRTGPKLLATRTSAARDTPNAAAR